MKKQRKEKKSLKLHKETIHSLLSSADLREAAGGWYSDSCFPDICQEKDSSAC